jgi:tetratricopeptide (TPR) repeat protein
MSPWVEQEGYTMLPRLFLAYGQAARIWWHGRRWGPLLRGLPALLSGGAALAVALACLLTPAREVQARYLEEGRSASHAGNHLRALTCYERLVGVEERPEALYQLALAAEAQGDLPRAAGLMARLAPPGRQGHGPAHLWCAQQLLLTPRSSAAARSAAETHLVRALDGGVEDREAVHGLLGQLYLSRGRLDDAELHLNRAVRTRPQLRLWLARLHALRKDNSRARREAELALGHLRARAKADLFNHAARLGWADAAAFLEDFPEARAILEEGLRATQDPVYHAALGRLHVSWFDIRKRDRAPMAEQIRLLEAGLRHDPGNTDLLDRLLQHLLVRGPEAGQAREVLQGLVAGGEGSAAVHFALGVDAMQRGKKDAARVHWERAHELAPHMPVVANNLAWMLAQAPSPDLPRALELVNLALEQDPDSARYRETRGQVLARMSRWKDALPDLEAALAAFPDSPELHRALDEVYGHLGLDELAARHRGLARAKAARPAAPAASP